MMSYEKLLHEMALADERVVVLTAENRAAIRDLPVSLGERFIDTGITEQALVGIASGLALRGRIPVVHALAAFLTMRAFEFIRTDIGFGNLPVKLVGGVPGFFSEANGPTHQAIEDVSLMRGIPGMRIFCPADEQDMLIGLRQILLSPQPFYVRFNGQKAKREHSRDFQIGKAETIGDGDEITLLVYGMLFDQADGARQILEAEGHSVRLINLRTLKPIDEAAILQAAQETSLLVTIEDHFLTGGLFSIVAELLTKHQRRARVLPIALKQRGFRPGLLHEVLMHEGFTAAQIAERIMQHEDLPTSRLFNPARMAHAMNSVE
jgi:transketolase